MDNLYERVRKYVLDREMIRPGESLVAGVSGGADSLCLFLVLLRMSREEGFCLQVVHVHHGLRESAQGDLRFVQDLCRRENVPCRCIMADAAAMAEKWGTGVEEAGRRLRYEAFEETRKSLQEDREKPCRIAVAHHREDQAETVLFHLCRGTDIRGARGMLPVSGWIVRPLLRESRAEIEAFLKSQGMAWREDETNEDTSYTRNFLRREILPRLKEQVNPSASENLARFAASCAETERFLEAQTEQAMKRCLLQIPGPLPVNEDGSGDRGKGNASESRTGESAGGRNGIRVGDRDSIPVTVLGLEALRQEDPLLQRRILYRCLAASAGRRKDLTAVHVDAMEELCAGQRDGSLSLPGRVTMLRSGGRLFFYRKDYLQKDSLQKDSLRKDYLQKDSLQKDSLRKDYPQKDSLQKDSLRKDYPQKGILQKDNIREDILLKGSMRKDILPAGMQRRCGAVVPLSREEYDCRVFGFDGDLSAIPQNEYTKWFDYDKIGMFPVFRTRQNGDRMTLSAGGGGLISKKLARVMIDGKIPAAVRPEAVLPFRGDEALWIPGLRMGDGYRITSGTRRVLEISWRPGGL